MPMIETEEPGREVNTLRLGEGILSPVSVKRLFASLVGYVRRKVRGGIPMDMRLVYFVLSLLFLAPSVGQAAVDDKVFTDVGHNYEEAVDYLVEKGITNGIGDGTFGTSRPIKRGDAAIFIGRARQLDLDNAPDQGFTDLNSRVADAVNAIVKAGIASGKSTTEFKPDANITRQEMARMLANAYGLTATGKAGFTDVSDRWIGYVSALEEHRITFGKGAGTFAPLDNLTRGEFALFIYRAEQVATDNPEMSPPSEDQVFNQRVENIQRQWQKWKPVYEGPVFEEAPSAESPYRLGKVHRGELADALNLTKFIRYLAYLPTDLRLNESFNEQAQAASVVNAANGKMTHYPAKPAGMPNDLYELGYEGAGTSNIGIGYTSIEKSILNGYMSDDDEVNREKVGHRRWILSPRLKEVGFGYAKAANGRGHTAMKVVTPDMWKNEPASYEMITWPSKHAFPTGFIGNRDPWSISLDSSKYDVDKSQNSKVRLTRKRDGKKWAFSRENSADGFFNISTESVGYIPFTIIFQPEGIEEYRAGDMYEVEISNVYDMKGSKREIRFTTTFFDLE